VGGKPLCVGQRRGSFPVAVPRSPRKVPRRRLVQGTAWDLSGGCRRIRRSVPILRCRTFLGPRFAQHRELADLSHFRRGILRSISVVSRSSRSLAFCSQLSRSLALSLSLSPLSPLSLSRSLALSLSRSLALSLSRSCSLALALSLSPLSLTLSRRSLALLYCALTRALALSVSRSRSRSRFRVSLPSPAHRREVAGHSLNAGFLIFRRLLDCCLLVLASP
jgi:hypothetical protein